MLSVSKLTVQRVNFDLLLMVEEAIESVETGTLQSAHHRPSLHNER
jgi:hypothetical protein